MKRKLFNSCLFLVALFIFSSCSKDLVGTWETTNVSMRPSREIAQFTFVLKMGKSEFYATSYEFKSDNSFVKLIKEDETVYRTNQTKFTGKFTQNNSLLILESDSAFVKNIGEDWIGNAVAASPFGFQFGTFELEIIRQGRNRMVIRKNFNNPNDGYARIILRRVR